MLLCRLWGVLQLNYSQLMFLTEVPLPMMSSRVQKFVMYLRQQKNEIMAATVSCAQLPYVASTFSPSKEMDVSTVLTLFVFVWHSC